MPVTLAQIRYGAVLIRWKRLRCKGFAFPSPACGRRKSLQAFADRLHKARKPKMVTRIALAHKLLFKLKAKGRDARFQFANATTNQMGAHPSQLHLATLSNKRERERKWR
jgi:hypothetical protein